MYLLNQPSNGNLGTLLLSNLNENYNSFKFIVAYAKLSGVRYLENTINSFKSNGGQVIGTVGIDQHNTSLEAIQRLLVLCDELYIYHSEVPTQTFHPKVYLFESENNIWFSSGSSNLTSGGLFTNYETNIYGELQLNDCDTPQTYTDIQELFKLYTNTSNNCCLKVTTELIYNLHERGYIYSEEIINRNGLTREHSSNSHERIFGSERFTAPRISHDISDRYHNNIEDEEIVVPNNDITTIYTNPIVTTNCIETYDSLYGSYNNFIQHIDGFTKNYYHIPQGVHLGHIFYIIKSLGDGLLDYRLRLFNSSTTGTDGTTVRQTNYKVAACMELLLLFDYRLPENTNNPSFSLTLSNNGLKLLEVLNNNVTNSDFYDFYTNSNTTWRMKHNNVDYYINFIRNLDDLSKSRLYEIFSNLNIFRLLVDYVSNHPTGIILISELYDNFWTIPSVSDYLNLIDISIPARSSLEHRIPFLISLLKAFSLVDSDINNPSQLIRL
ncbi:hypothetical protein ACQPUY_03330 [Clostridium nigeriense]|uniref:hypothetical protein n=1 Tax=Clostridium nigeriense TaxID=1805470 RepID=UPI003D337021